MNENIVAKLKVREFSCHLSEVELIGKCLASACRIWKRTLDPCQLDNGGWNLLTLMLQEGVSQFHKFCWVASNRSRSTFWYCLKDVDLDSNLTSRSWCRSSYSMCFCRTCLKGRRRETWRIFWMKFKCTHTPKTQLSYGLNYKWDFLISFWHRTSKFTMQTATRMTKKKERRNRSTWKEDYFQGSFFFQRNQEVRKIKTIPPETPIREDSVRFVCVSDTHNKTNRLRVPPGDVLLHAGDFTMTGQMGEVEHFNTWLGMFLAGCWHFLLGDWFEEAKLRCVKEQLPNTNDYFSSGTLPHKHKIVIAGNHDISFDDNMLAEYETRFRFRVDAEEVRW